MITAYHAKYYANLLRQKNIGGNLESLSQSLMNASVDINPHQIEAALFALHSPFSKGVILADEVGLGKTIEAGLVLCQYWSTGRHKILVICPASLRKQWSYELTEKFGMPNLILDTKNYKEAIRKGGNLLQEKKILICSYYFAAHKSEEIRKRGFDLAVIDEAHKLRNVYKKSAKTAHAVKAALKDTKKLLLTATPFQNSLMELFGLTSIIDENIFGDSKSFRSMYSGTSNIFDLRQRLNPYYKRTLRKDVTEYINYTRRLPMTQKFETTDPEQELYEEVSEFLRRDDLYSVPQRQRMLTTMIIRKILASSTYALIGTLTTLRDRLVQMLSQNSDEEPELNLGIQADDLGINEETEETEETKKPSLEKIKIDKKKLSAEIKELEHFISLAQNISCDSKSQALLKALKEAFERLPSLGANQKALIFTESTRTQQYLKDLLQANGYKGEIVLFNGTNTDADSTRIYNAWIQQNTGTGKISGIKAADRKAAIVDYFQNHAKLMIATEAASEGLNLQFCSLVVNYDLPWNPQRIEQRIGRCHRYGQKSDVVVVNFVNERNYADVRVFKLLSEKFNLFDNVFGASDEVLGQINEVDFERRIWEIYQNCRTEKEIAKAFEQLQKDMQEEINDRLDEVKKEVLQNFDIAVQERLKLAKEKTRAFMTRYEYIFWTLTKFILQGKAVFDDDKRTFCLNASIPGCEMGKYRLASDLSQEGRPYRFSCPLAQYVIHTAEQMPLPKKKVIFTPENNIVKVTLPDYLRHTEGTLQLAELAINAFEDEQYSLLTAYTSSGQMISQEDCEKLFLCTGILKGTGTLSGKQENLLQEGTKKHAQRKMEEIDSRNLEYFHEEEDRIYRWEQDMVDSLENELDSVKKQIREMERLSRQAATLEEKKKAGQRLMELERQKRKKRNELADREDEIGDQRRKMLEELDHRMAKSTTVKPIFEISWQVQ